MWFHPNDSKTCTLFQRYITFFVLVFGTRQVLMHHKLVISQCRNIVYNVLSAMVQELHAWFLIYGRGKNGSQTMYYTR